MYQNQFDKLLNNKKVPNSVMFFGESHFLIDRYFEKLKKYFDVDEVVTFYNFDYSLDNAIGSVSQGSLFAERTLLVIKSDDKISAKDLKVLIEIVKNSKDNFFAYLYYGDDYRVSQKAFMRTDKKAEFVRFFNPNDQNILNIIWEETHKLNYEISRDGAVQLIHLKNSNLSLIMIEIQKLANFGKPLLDRNDILESVSPSVDIELDQIIEYFFKSKNFQKLMQFVDIKAMDEIMTISYMVKFVEELYFFRSAFETGNPTDAFAVLGRKLPPQVEQAKQRNSQIFNISQISKFLTILMSAELKFKSGQVGDKNAFFVATLLKLVK